MGVFKSETEKKFVIFMSIFILLVIFVIIPMIENSGRDKMNSCDCYQTFKKVEMIGITDSNREMYNLCKEDYVSSRVANNECLNNMGD